MKTDKLSFTRASTQGEGIALNDYFSEQFACKKAAVQKDGGVRSFSGIGLFFIGAAQKIVHADAIKISQD